MHPPCGGRVSGAPGRAAPWPKPARRRSGRAAGPGADRPIAAAGKVVAELYNRCRRHEFPDVINRVVVERGEREAHVILGNLGTLERKHDRWLAPHLNVQFRFTPIRTSSFN